MLTHCKIACALLYCDVVVIACSLLHTPTAADCCLQDLNSPDYAGVTPLHLACSLQDWEAVNVLLDLKVSTHTDTEHLYMLLVLHTISIQ
jgi:ankyrin repeat protein